jgi:hypothetical protein
MDQKKEKVEKIKNCICGRELKLIKESPTQIIQECDFCKAQRVITFTWAVVK